MRLGDMCSVTRTPWKGCSRFRRRRPKVQKGPGYDRTQEKGANLKHLAGWGQSAPDPIALKACRLFVRDVCDF